MTTLKSLLLIIQTLQAEHHSLVTSAVITSVVSAFRAAALMGDSVHCNRGMRRNTLVEIHLKAHKQFPKHYFPPC